MRLGLLTFLLRRLLLLLGLLVPLVEVYAGHELPDLLHEVWIGLDLLLKLCRQNLGLALGLWELLLILLVLDVAGCGLPLRLCCFQHLLLVLHCLVEHLDACLYFVALGH